MNPQIPTWRLWLVGILMVGWALLAIRFLISKEWLMVALCVILSISNAFTLWRLKIQSSSSTMQDVTIEPKVDLIKDSKQD